MYLFILLQEVVTHKLEITDFITDSFAGELGIALVLERLVSRFQGWMKHRDHKQKEEREEAAKKLVKEAEDKRIDTIDRKLAELKGKQDAFAQALIKK